MSDLTEGVWVGVSGGTPLLSWSPKGGPGEIVQAHPLKPTFIIHKGDHPLSVSFSLLLFSQGQKRVASCSLWQRLFTMWLKLLRGPPIVLSLVPGGTVALGQRTHRNTDRTPAFSGRNCCYKYNSESTLFISQYVIHFW